jgi:hypothetical protein
VAKALPQPSLRRRLEVYRALLRRGPAVPELQRLVAMLEDELRQPAQRPARPARR